jgi:hypothetical protein
MQIEQSKLHQLASLKNGADRWSPPSCSPFTPAHDRPRIHLSLVLKPYLLRRVRDGDSAPSPWLLDFADRGDASLPQRAPSLWAQRGMATVIAEDKSAGTGDIAARSFVVVVPQWREPQGSQALVLSSPISSRNYSHYDFICFVCIWLCPCSVFAGPCWLFSTSSRCSASLRLPLPRHYFVGKLHLLMELSIIYYSSSFCFLIACLSTWRGEHTKVPQLISEWRDRLIISGD